MIGHRDVQVHYKQKLLALSLSPSGIMTPQRVNLFSSSESLIDHIGICELDAIGNDRLHGIIS